MEKVLSAIRKLFAKRDLPIEKKNSTIHEEDSVFVTNHISFTTVGGENPDPMFTYSKIRFVVMGTKKERRIFIKKNDGTCSSQLQDLVIIEPGTKKKFRVSSKHVRRVDWIKCTNGK
ncbi:MAG: hypothetical protein HGA67_02485 [Candidatus Yonathbacteria bacterium]|nr:hypothetical protein [Candidatus Yonathbacteria bacterium]